MDSRPPTSGNAMSPARVAQQLGLSEVHAAWLAKWDEAQPSSPLQVLHPDAASALLDRLGLAREDAADVLRTMPSPDRDPALWWLLERGHSVFVRSLASRSNQPGGEPIPELPAALRLFPVHLILVSVAAVRERQQALGVPDDIAWETLSYLGRAISAYRAGHGEAGIRLTGWEWLRFSAWLYQVGRLEVTPYWLLTHPEVAGPLFWYDDETAARLGPGLEKGAAALSLHIPAVDPLTPEACSESLHRMQAAFKTMQPGGPPQIATCTSWVLDEQLVEYLPADSNILAFQRRFTLVPGARDSDDWILRVVFGIERPKALTDLDALPQRTTLERGIVEHLRQGRHWRMRTGWLRLTG
jgi:hypothetical protein